MSIQNNNLGRAAFEGFQPQKGAIPPKPPQSALNGPKGTAIIPIEDSEPQTRARSVRTAEQKDVLKSQFDNVKGRSLSDVKASRAPSGDSKVVNFFKNHLNQNEKGSAPVSIFVPTPDKPQPTPLHVLDENEEPPPEPSSLKPAPGLNEEENKPLPQDLDIDSDIPPPPPEPLLDPDGKEVLTNGQQATPLGFAKEEEYSGPEDIAKKKDYSEPAKQADPDKPPRKDSGINFPPLPPIGRAD